MSNQPEALRLADAIDRYNAGVCSQAIYEDYSKAAAELRRLHALNQELLGALKAIIGDQPEDKWGYFAAHNAMDDDKRQAARTVIAKAEGGI